MSHENGQFDIPVIQLRESKTQPRVSLSREIGEAQITHTIFGRAKVRIIRKGDQARRNMIMAAIAVVVVAAAAWQGWFAPQQIEPAQSGVPAASTEAPGSLPVSQTENTIPPAIPATVLSAPAMPTAAGITPPSASNITVQQQPADLKDAGQKTVKPAQAQPKPVTIKPKAISPVPMTAPQSAPVATSQEALKNPTNMPPPARVLPAKRPAMPAVAIPAQPAASSPVAVVPLGKEDVTIQSPIGDKQLSDPINAPEK